MLINPSDVRDRRLAFFLDVDGTLLEIASEPDAVRVDEEVLDLLRSLIRATDGAVAFISGRSIANLDELFSPLQLPAAGLHGFERRNATGALLRRPPPDSHALDRARGQLRRLVDRYPGTLLEDKRFGFAVHYRRVPLLGDLLVPQVEAIARPLAESLQIQLGRCVIELRPRGATKASAIAEFMREAPFEGRWPVCLGDDLTDEHAFEWINAAGGYSLAVGVDRESAAQAHIETVTQARAWLRKLVQPDRSGSSQSPSGSESGP